MGSGVRNRSDIATIQRRFLQRIRGVLSLILPKNNLLARITLLLSALVLGTTLCLSYPESAFGGWGGGGWRGGGFHSFGSGFRGFGGGFRGFDSVPALVGSVLVSETSTPDSRGSNAASALTPGS